MGRIVKGLGRVIPAVVLDARAEAAAMLAEAGARANALRAEAEATRDEARRTGYEAGLAEGRAAAAVTLAAARAEATRALEAAIPASIAVARKMAEKIVGRAIALEPAVMAEIVAEALDASRPRGATVRVRLHPDDVAVVASRREALAARAPAAAGIELVPDPSVGRSGCVLETPFGRVDARLEAQLDALERALGELHA